MDASRLLEVLTDVEDEFPHYQKLIAALVQAYTTARDSPATDYSVTISSSLFALSEFLQQSRFNEYPPSKRQILKAIGGSELVGSAGLDKLDSKLALVGITGAALVTVTTTFNSEIERFAKVCADAKVALIGLDIKPHSVDPGTCEVGVLIPPNISHGTLSGLNEILNQWNTILRGFAELAGEQEREIPVTGLATGSYDAFLAIAFNTGKFLTHAIDKILEWYKKILEIKDARLKLAGLGAPVSEANAVKTFEKDLLQKAIVEIVQELLEQSQTKLQPARRNEIENHLTISIRHVAKFIDHGGDVEVTPGIPEVPPEPQPPAADAPDAPDGGPAQEKYLKDKQTHDALASEAASAREIAKKGAGVGSLPPRPTPILQLGDSTQDGEGEKKN